MYSFLTKARTLLESMAITRKEAMSYMMNATMAHTMMTHFMLLQVLPNNEASNHWRKECKIFLENCLGRTVLKSGILKKKDFMYALWEGPAETSEQCMASANSKLQDEGYSKQERIAMLKTVDWNDSSLLYREWLSKWYDYYHNPHSTTGKSLPQNLFD